MDTPKVVKGTEVSMLLAETGERAKVMANVVKATLLRNDSMMATLTVRTDQVLQRSSGPAYK